MKKNLSKIIAGSAFSASLFFSNTLWSQVYVSSANGLVHTMAVDRYDNPGVGVNEVFQMTGSFIEGTTWVLNIADLNPTDGLESQAQNVYNNRFDVSGARADLDAAGLAPWNTANEQFRNSWNTTAFDNLHFNRSYFRAYGDYALTGINANYISSGSQDYFSPTSYSFSFSKPLTEVYMYIQDLDDAMIYDFNYTPEIVVTSLPSIWGGPEGNAGLLGQLTYNASLNAIHDADGRGEGLAYGSVGLPFSFTNMDGWNPSSAGVIKFSDPNGINTLNFSVKGLVPSLDGNLEENSDGFLFTLAVPLPVPEPSSLLLISALSGGFLLRRRR